MGHGHILTDAHRALVKRLESGTAGLPEPEDPRARQAWQAILETLFSPEEAKLAALCALPPVEKLLAGEQLQSRFVRFVLSRVQNPSC